MSRHFYVYKLTLPQTGEFYYGRRLCKCNPKDDNYMGSMKTWKPDKSNLVKEIIKECKSFEESQELENKYIKKYINHELNRNYCINGKWHAFSKKGMKLTDIHKNNISKGMLNSKKYKKAILNPDRSKKMIKTKIKNNTLNHTEETKIKISKNNRSYLLEVKKKISETIKRINKMSTRFYIENIFTKEIFVTEKQAGLKNFLKNYNKDKQYRKRVNFTLLICNLENKELRIIKKEKINE